MGCDNPALEIQYVELFFGAYATAEDEPPVHNLRTMLKNVEQDTTMTNNGNEFRNVVNTDNLKLALCVTSLKTVSRFNSIDLRVFLCSDNAKFFFSFHAFERFFLSA